MTDHTPLTDEQLAAVVEHCRECRDLGGTAPADFILWGKLFPSEALGPRCYDHAARWFSAARVDQWAVYDLRPARAIAAKVRRLRTKLGAVEALAERASRKGDDLDPGDVLNALGATTSEEAQR